MPGSRIVVATLIALALLGPAARTGAQAPVAQAEVAVRHPLDPLGPEEIELAVATIREARKLPEGVRFVSVALNEPEKAKVLHPTPGAAVPREARVVLLDRATGRGYEALVDLSARSVPRYEALPEGVQPPVLLEEFGECEETAKKSPAFREALKKRGIEDMSLVMVDAWSAGHYGGEPPEDRGRRYVRALTWVKASATDNGYAHPVEGLMTIIDLNRKEVVRVEDLGVVPVPAGPGNWGRADVAKVRADLKPLEVVQADGPSFEVRGREVRWQKWTFRVGFTPREGLVLHTVAYDGRPVLYRGSIAEMVVPYGDPKESAYRKNVFDLGEYGVGILANSLALGCDCLGTIRYFDGCFADNHGRPVVIKNAVCLHEEDVGLLWKHTDWRTAQSEVRRARRLAVSMIANVGNYDYGFYWYFHQDGSIQMEMKLTGIVNTQALKPGETPKHGTEVAPRLNAPNHQHFFNARLDLDVDGEANAAQEVNVRSDPEGPENPHGNAFYAETTALETESAARRDADPASARFWRVVNASKTNALGGPVGYRLCPGETLRPFARPSFAVLKRAQFLTHNLWVTPYRADERYPAGEYPNQNPEDAGLGAWTKADRGLAKADVVLWYNFGQTHIPRVEDWPVMPSASVGFALKPDGFFDANPALDVAPTALR
ncbi:primary-amine oxidase [Paludisphaera mucosa]|uniref:Amine oxidase n=1 Tax=Paludisphaera mucosa TaxID=3030827 RepID=A0ABT6FB97_9BACT|nr:primary-amine oxidase [Paludisphaera mucosa]MDG3004867.1 primary-amine oxidase [Paludisphaera mucosa]